MRRDATIQDVARAMQLLPPGLDAQRRMSTRPRPIPQEGHLCGSPRQAAVLILLYLHDGQLYFPLTRRAERLARHKAEVALPGGAQERDDHSLWDTAVRETFEEIGVEPHTVCRLGSLSTLYVPASNFEVHPFVGHVRYRPTFMLDASEVAELIEFPLHTILDADARAEEQRYIRGYPVQVPFYRYKQHKIWGATAMILSELEVALATVLSA